MAQPIATGRASLDVTRSLTRAMIHGAWRVRPERGRIARSLRIVVCVVAPLAVGLAIDELRLALLVSFGAFAGFHGHVEPYPQRARVVAAMGIGYLLAVMTGLLASQSPVVGVIVTGAFATVACFTCQALSLPAPREFMLIMICLLVGALPQAPASALEMAGLTALGGLWAWLVLMSGWFTDRERPEREALRTGLRATISLVGASRGARPAKRHDAVLAQRTARRSVEFAGGPTAPLLREVQLAAEDLLDAALALGPPAPAEGPDADPDDAQRRVVMRRRLGRLIERTDAAMPRRGLRRATHDGGLPPLRSGMWSLRNALGADSLVPPTALRLGVAVAAGLALGHASGVERPYWIPLTTAAVMQGATLLTTARRAIERATGTVIGILIAALIVAADPGSWWIVAGIGVFLFLSQLTIASSYVIAVVFLTPMTLLLAETGAPGSLSDSLVEWRLANTLIGCALGFLAGRLLWPSESRQRLDRALGRAVDGVEALLGVEDADRSGRLLVGSVTAQWMLGRTDSPGELRARRMAAGRGRSGRAAAAQARGGMVVRDAHEPDHQRAARHELRVRLLNARAVTDAALGDRFTSAPREDELWPVAAAVQQLGYRALARREGPTEDLHREVARLRRELAGQAGPG